MKNFMAIGLMLILAFDAQATVLTFDDLGYDEAYIADGYGGFYWANNDVAPVLSMGANLQNQYDPNNGFKNAAVSGGNIAFNGWGEQHSVISLIGAGSFNFTGAYWTSGWENQTLSFEGLLDGVVKYGSASFQINLNAPLWISLNWADIDQLRINNSGSHWAMDNFTFTKNGTVNVPEPSSFLLLMVSLGLLMFIRLKSRVVCKQ